MPKINFDDMPYDPEESTGEHVRKNAFYLPNPSYEESSDIYRGYHTIDTTGLTFNNPVLLRETVYTEGTDKGIALTKKRKKKKD